MLMLYFIKNIPTSHIICIRKYTHDAFVLYYLKKRTEQTFYKKNIKKKIYIQIIIIISFHIEQ